MFCYCTLPPICSIERASMWSVCMAQIVGIQLVFGWNFLSFSFSNDIDLIEKRLTWIFTPHQITLHKHRMRTLRTKILSLFCKRIETLKEENKSSFFKIPKIVKMKLVRFYLMIFSHISVINLKCICLRPISLEVNYRVFIQTWINFFPIKW